MADIYPQYLPMYVLTGQRLNLTCIVTGPRRVATIRWSRNTTACGTVDHIRNGYEGFTIAGDYASTVSRLTKDSVCHDDDGIYQCDAFNTSGGSTFLSKPPRKVVVVDSKYRECGLMSGTHSVYSTDICSAN